MSVPQLPHPTFERLLAASRELRGRLGELREALIGCDDRGQTVALLDDLRHRLTLQFHREEEGGYFGEMLAAAPQLTTEARRLERQHAALLAQLADLEERARRCTDTAQWEALRQAGARFRAELERHERAEMELVQETLTTDLGTED